MSPETAAKVEEWALARRAWVANLAQESSGLAWCAAHTQMVDDAIRTVVNQVLAEFSEPVRLSVVATGGYGRRELAPCSDVDLTVIPLDEGAPHVDQAVRRIYRLLNHAIGSGFRLNLSYAYRLVNDAPALDGKTRTGLLDARLVAGTRHALQAFQELFRESFPVGEFLIDKIREREAHYREHHDTPLVVEAHLKEGAGGLRCFQAANWLRVTLGEIPALPTEAYDRVIEMRNLLHHVSGRAQDRLTRQRQAEIADLRGEDLFAMMSRLCEAMTELHGEYCRALERVGETRFTVSPGVMALRGEARIRGDASLSQAAEGIALATQLGLRVEELESAGRDTVEGPSVLFALQTGEATLRNLDRCGILGRLLPELDACRTLMPSDSTHSFTVFEHTLRVVRHLDAMASRADWLSGVMGGISGKGPLYLAALLHDVGKADQSAPHSETGARMAREVGRRWTLPGSLIELVAWLVEEHLTLSKFVRVRDVNHPQTARELAKLVMDRERLDLLTLLTHADISAVGPDAWTPAQEHFLRVLYEQTCVALDAEQPQAADPATFRKRLRRQIRDDAFSDAEVEAFLASLPAHYLVSTPPETVREHMQFERLARQGEATVEMTPRPTLGNSDLTVCCPDAPGLLSRLLGVLYAWDLSVQGIRVSTTATETPVALDTFTVAFGGQPVPPATAAHVISDLREMLAGTLDVNDLLRHRGKDPERLQEHFEFVYVEGLPGILEVRAPRGRGLAFRMSRFIADLGWNIVAARFGQWAGRGAAAFYVMGPGERALSREEVEGAIRR